MPEMMMCGHAANSTKRLADGSGIPACVICMCTDVVAEPVDLSGRLAQCSYYDKAVSIRLRDKGGCSTRINQHGTNEERTCYCEVPSSSKLWFFEHRPAQLTDSFYCGCWGYD